MTLQSKIQNPKSKIRTFYNITILTIALFSSQSYASDKLSVYTVNYPLKYFAERIGGEHVEVVFPAPADDDPAYWMPDKKTIAEYQKADLILLNGAHYAKWVEKVTLPRSKMVDTSRKFKHRFMKLESAVTHSHGPGGKHAHEDVAFTLWLDLDLAAKQAKAIEKALSRKRPAMRPAFKKNYASLERELLAMDAEIKRIVSKDQYRPLIASHPVYDYLSYRYTMNMRSVHWEPDQKPTVSQWIELKKIIKNHSAKWMVWEGEPVQESVEALRSIGIESVVFDPCGNVPDKGDFLAVMQQNVENLEQIYK